MIGDIFRAFGTTIIMICMKRAFYILAVLLILAILSLAVFRLITQRTQESATPDVFDTTHLVGGFTIDTPDRAARAAANGIQAAFEYGQPPAEDSVLGQKLQSLHMRVIDGYISSTLHYYECHRIKVLNPSLPEWTQYCQRDYYPYLNDEHVLLGSIAAHLRQVKENPLVIGYWVLDDWISWDAGSARQILIDIHKLIQQYTPGRPAICGLGGGYIGQGTTYRWIDWVADNFSPQGCDRVGLYVYTPSLPDTTPMSSPDTYNWSMSGLLPTIFASLEKRGWDIMKEPLIGIVQAFGGPRARTNLYWVTPTAKDIEIQSRSFCEHGATGLAFYGWNDSEFGPTTQTPMNNTEIEIGIQRGIAGCKHYWSAHS